MGPKTDLRADLILGIWDDDSLKCPIVQIKMKKIDTNCEPLKAMFLWCHQSKFWEVLYISGRWIHVERIGGVRFFSLWDKNTQDWHLAIELHFRNRINYEAMFLARNGFFSSLSLWRRARVPRLFADWNLPHLSMSWRCW